MKNKHVMDMERTRQSRFRNQLIMYTETLSLNNLE